MGDEETAIFGNLRRHSCVYPVDATDVLLMRNTLRRDSRPPTDSFSITYITRRFAAAK